MNAGLVHGHLDRVIVVSGPESDVLETTWFHCPLGQALLQTEIGRAEGYAAVPHVGVYKDRIDFGKLRYFLVEPDVGEDPPGQQHISLSRLPSKFLNKADHHFFQLLLGRGRDFLAGVGLEILFVVVQQQVHVWIAELLAFEDSQKCVGLSEKGRLFGQVVVEFPPVIGQEETAVEEGVTLIRVPVGGKARHLPLVPVSAEPQVACNFRIEDTWGCAARGPGNPLHLPIFYRAYAGAQPIPGPINGYYERI